MDIKFSHLGEPDCPALCNKCNSNLQSVITEGHKEGRTRFAFNISHKKDGTPIKDLETKGALLGVIELAYCQVCDDYEALIDCTEDQEFWSSLPKWERRN
jgi:hypothetical protein